MAAIYAGYTLHRDALERAEAEDILRLLGYMRDTLTRMGAGEDAEVQLRIQFLMVPDDPCGYPVGSALLRMTAET